jgi:hypothetical protein
MDDEKRKVAEPGGRDERLERLMAEVAIIRSASDPAARARELILLANDPWFWADEDGNVL